MKGHQGVPTSPGEREGDYIKPQRSDRQKQRGDINPTVRPSGFFLSPCSERGDRKTRNQGDSITKGVTGGAYAFALRATNRAKAGSYGINKICKVWQTLTQRLK